MKVPTDPILLDNCAISACVEAGAWAALISRYIVETVLIIEEEATTGHQHRNIIPPQQFRNQVKIHEITDEVRFEAQMIYAGLGYLDDGERDLWIHALSRDGGWLLCGPDTASIKFGVLNGYADYLISLEALLIAIGLKPKIKLKENQTAKWLGGVVSDIKLEMLFKKNL